MVSLSTLTVAGGFQRSSPDIQAGRPINKRFEFNGFGCSRDNRSPADAGAAGGAKLPQGASQVRIDYGVAVWGGMCPPPGDKPHRDVFTVHALKTDKLELPTDATPALAGYMINAHALAKASFTATDGHPKAK